MNTPLDRLKHHVTGAIERGEKTAIVEKPMNTETKHTPEPIEIFEVLRDLVMALEAQYIDWDRFNQGPDHDPEYRPEFPEVVNRGNVLLTQFIEFAQIGQQWRKDSSLEKWFPFTAKEVEALKSNNEELLSALRGLSGAHDSGYQLCECGKCNAVRNAIAKHDRGIGQGEIKAIADLRETIAKATTGPEPLPIASAPDMAKEIAQLKADKAELVEGLRRIQNNAGARKWNSQSEDRFDLDVFSHIETSARNLISKHTKV